MLEEGKISIRQATLLMVTTVLATAILFLPAISTRQALQDAWISTIIATTNGVLIALLVVTLMRRFPAQTLIQYSEDIMGKFIGKIIGLGYIWFFLSTNAIIVREFGDFMVAAFMPRTPLLVFNAMIVILAIMAVKSGLEPLSRMNEWLFILNSFILIIIIFISLFEL
ncbi:MAG: GerAB/ArcD/ProY family transporter, partial [Candidatus Contubernalis sp.]|nr:GerAB/ArcD/ProY family transporter [Candidatus Contubernalis sp.]